MGFSLCGVCRVGAAWVVVNVCCVVCVMRMAVRVVWVSAAGSVCLDGSGISC